MRLFRSLAAILFLGLAPLVLAASASAQQTAAPSHPRVIGFMTDFDVKDDAIGICKAVMFSIAPEARVIDITHQSTPYDIAEGARFLAGSAPYFPSDAVFAIVIDPTVGSKRKAIIALSARGQYFVLPDNGLITLLKDKIVSAREITNPAWMIGDKLSSTFHGRDIFSPAAAHLARGDDWTTAGPSLDVAKLVRLGIPAPTLDASGLSAEVLGLDGPFGNVITNIPAETFAQLGYKLGDTVPITLGDQDDSFPFVRTFSDVPVGKPLFYIDSRNRLALSINQGDFSRQYKIAPGTKLFIPRKP